MKFPRASGILLHPTSLPGRFGIGDFGEEAYRFADFLVASAQSLWQILPLGPPDHGGSPYSSYSAFAGNTRLISPEKLFEEGLLTRDDLDAAPSLPTERVDFAQAGKIKDAFLEKAFARFQASGNAELCIKFEEFAARNASWLDDYALFRALRNAHAGAAWTEWDRSLALREAAALNQSRGELRSQIEAQKFFQYLVFKQWLDLKGYCNSGGIRLIGDIPMFVAHDSADVWANPDLFKLDENGKPTFVAGVPPDYFSATGQFWGNPLYDWDLMRRDGFKWWIDRIRATLQLVDVARIDHFRGFAACWEIPASENTAEHGQWVETPGRELFAAVRSELGELPIIAEDLGMITSDVHKLRDELGFPGMRVLQFAFNSDPDNIHLPDNYESNVVAYTGTHDNDTTVGWLESLTEENEERNFCLSYLNSDGREINWDFIRAVLASRADTAIISLQDVLGVGSEGRMNLPNSVDGNWRWRVKRESLTDALSQRLRELTTSSERVVESP
jgi:4-alpha-glucanotransferase